MALMKTIFLIIGILLILSIGIDYNLANASTENKSYDLSVDEHTFTIPYQSDSELISMDIDQESKSLLIGITNSNDSVFSVTLDKQLIDSQNYDFLVLVDGIDVDYQIVPNDNSNTLQFSIPADTEEIEIVGTYVIPEFPLGIFFVISIVMSGFVLITKYKKTIFM